jgi:hypothetical protein
VASSNAVQELRLDRNNMGSCELIFKPTQWAESESGGLMRPFDIQQPWPQLAGNPPSPNLTSDLAVAEALAQLAIKKPLKALSLQGNCLGENAVAHLAQSLQRAPALALAALNLSGNNTTSGSLMRQFNKGAVALGALLAVNSSLSSLDISCNGIRGSGAQAVAKGLRGNEALLSLSLAWNTFGDAKSLSHLRNWLVSANVASLGSCLRDRALIRIHADHALALVFLHWQQHMGVLMHAYAPRVYISIESLNVCALARPLLGMGVGVRVGGYG